MLTVISSIIFLKKNHNQLELNLLIKSIKYFIVYLLASNFYYEVKSSDFLVSPHFFLNLKVMQ